MDNEAYIGLISDPKNLGGDSLDLREVKLEPEHLNQMDTSLNAKLWSYFEVEEDFDWTTRLSPYDNKLPNGPPYAPADIASFAKRAESYILEQSLTSLCYLQYVLLVGPEAAQPVLQQVRDRKRRLQVDPLEEVVQRVSEKKKEINLWCQDGKYDLSLVSYIQCIFDLWPWCATPVFLTAAQCFDSGLAELEAALWNNIALCSKKSTRYAFVPRTMVGGSAGLHVVNMRYVPSNLRYKGYGQLTEGYIEVLKDRQRHGSPLPDYADVAVLEESMAEIKDKSSKGWAHRHCITEHVCYSDRMLAKIRAAACPPRA